MSAGETHPATTQVNTVHQEPSQLQRRPCLKADQMPISSALAALLHGSHLYGIPAFKCLHRLQHSVLISAPCKRQNR